MRGRKSLLMLMHLMHMRIVHIQMIAFGPGRIPRLLKKMAWWFEGLAIELSGLDVRCDVVRSNASTYDREPN